MKRILWSSLLLLIPGLAAADLRPPTTIPATVSITTITFNDGTIQNTAPIVVASSYSSVSLATSTAVTSFIPTLCKATITPSSATYKVNIIVHGVLEAVAAAAGEAAYATVFRGSTNLGNATEGLQRCSSYAAAVSGICPLSLVVQDAPATTTATTYTVYMRGDGSAGGTAQISRNSEPCNMLLQVSTK